ncbi:MAG: aminotransferase class I/II-fold pyridoxal phosphate-dependent enzyme [Pseudomonadota bacterium]
MTDLDRLFVHAAGAFDRLTGGVVPSIQPSTTFLRDADYALTSPNHVYGRDDEDLARLAQSILAQAEGGTDALVFPSGMAAVSAALRTVPNGGRIVQQAGIYWGTTKWTRDYCARRDITLIEVEASDLDALAAALKDPTDIVWVETPSNPYLKVTDIEAAAGLAHEAGAALIVDATAATPILLNPLSLGADLVMHSATKAINGHSDVLAGVLVTAKNDDRWQAIAMDRHDAGAVLNPFAAWLLIRGMRTLPLRIERMSANALSVATAMAAHPGVHTVLYPGLTDNPGHAIAAMQMKGGYGSLLSIRLAGGREAALRAVGRLEIFKRATSLGGVESLVEHRHSIEEAVPDDLLRLSCGIETADTLIADLQQALAE